MEDHHVDRPDVEVRQRMKLTGTNSSIGLIVLINQCPLVDGLNEMIGSDTSDCVTCMGYTAPRNKTRIHSDVFRRSGGDYEGPRTRSHPELDR